MYYGISIVVEAIERGHAGGVASLLRRRARLASALPGLDSVIVVLELIFGFLRYSIRRWAGSSTAS